MELICDVIIRDRRTGRVVDEAKSVSSAKPLVLNENERVIYRFDFQFSTAIDKRLVDQIEQIGRETEND